MSIEQRMSRFLLACLVTLAPALALAEPPVARTTAGMVSGVTAGDLHIYRGIPYAAPPLGERRWRAPAPVAPWTGVRKADRFGPVCSQKRDHYPPWAVAHFDAVGISEDCLTLNIWRPAEPGEKPWPVMVYIHGGNMKYGAGSLPKHDGSVLARNGLVIVTINYRVGFLGQFDHPALARTQPEEPRGNYGIQDQIAALRWVRENIAAFGGDPDQVTIFGHSAGGVSVNVLMATPGSAGLFQRAIAQGSAFLLDGDRRVAERGPPGSQATPLSEIGAALATNFGVSGNDATVARSLRAIPAADIVVYQEKQLISFNPVVDGRTLPDDVARIFERGQQHNVPYIGGANSWERGQITDIPLIGKWFMAGVMLEGLSDEDLAPFDDQWTRIGVMERWFSEGLFLASTRYLAAQMSHVSAPAWLFHITYVQESMRGKIPGTVHGYEVPHIFGVLKDRPEINQALPPDLSAADFAWGEKVREYWINFARTGNPNGAGLPHWPPYEPDTDLAMVLGEEMAPQADLYKETLDYLDRRALLRRAAFDKSRGAR